MPRIIHHEGQEDPTPDEFPSHKERDQALGGETIQRADPTARCGGKGPTSTMGFAGVLSCPLDYRAGEPGAKTIRAGMRRC
jgi:hypothetical protein